MASGGEQGITVVSQMIRVTNMEEQGKRFEVNKTSSVPLKITGKYTRAVINCRSLPW